MEALGEAVRSYFNGEAYQNFIDPTLIDWEQAYYAKNFARLVDAYASRRMRMMSRAGPCGCAVFLRRAPGHSRSSWARSQEACGHPHVRLPGFPLHLLEQHSESSTQAAPRSEHEQAGSPLQSLSAQSA